MGKVITTTTDSSVRTSQFNEKNVTEKERKGYLEVLAIPPSSILSLLSPQR